MILKTLKMASGSIFFEWNCKFKDTKYVQTMQLMIYLCLFKRCLAQSFQCLAHSGHSLKAGEIGVSSSTITYRISIVLGNLGKKIVRLGDIERKGTSNNHLGRQKQSKAECPPTVLTHSYFICNILSTTKVKSTYWNINSIHDGRSHLIHL